MPPTATDVLAGVRAAERRIRARRRAATAAAAVAAVSAVATGLVVLGSATEHVPRLLHARGAVAVAAALIGRDLLRCST